MTTHDSTPVAGAASASAASADDRRAVTGKRRIAFAVYVADVGELPGLQTLLRSLALTDPALCEDVVVLHPGLPDASFDAAHRLHPRLTPRPAVGRHDVFRLDGYDTVIALTPALVVLGRIDALLRLRTGVAAVPRTGPEGVPDPRHGIPDDGLLVIQRQDLDHAVPPAAARDVPESVLVPLDSRYDFRALRLREDLAVPEGVVVLNFAGTQSPCTGPAHAARARFDLDDEAFRAAYLALPGAKHPDLLLHLALPFPDGSRPPIDLVRQLAEIHRGRGHHDLAVALLGEAVADRPDLPRCHETLGVCLMALSRYEEAETHLLLATASPDFAPRAYGQLARMAWLLGRTEDARGYALAGLESDPTDANCRAWYARTSEMVTAGATASDTPPGEQLAHVALFAEGDENAGDKVLPEAVRSCFTADTGPDRWHQQHAHLLVDEAGLERLNARRAVIVGGGGLFLPDTAPNGNSGWQWNIPDDVLARITAPWRSSPSATTSSTASATGASGSRPPCEPWSSGPRSSGCATTAPSPGSGSCCPPHSARRCATSPVPPRSPATSTPASPNRPYARTPSSSTAPTTGPGSASATTTGTSSRRWPRRSGPSPVRQRSVTPRTCPPTNASSTICGASTASFSPWSRCTCSPTTRFATSTGAPGW